MVASIQNLYAETLYQTQEENQLKILTSLKKYNYLHQNWDYAIKLGFSVILSEWKISTKA